MSQIRCEDISLGYDSREILGGVSFAVDRGDYLCIVGENGSGKTTLMRALLGLHQPIKGSIVMGEGLGAKDIGYLPQQTEVQRDFPATVKEVVMSGCLSRSGFRPFYNAVEKRAAADAMEKMGITHLEKRCFRELSGGQRQRALLARALCATGKILLLDEPVSGLDPMVTAELYELIYELNQKEQITVIMISHDINATINYASHVLHIGKEVFFGTTSEYLVSPMGRSICNCNRNGGTGNVFNF